MHRIYLHKTLVFKRDLNITNAIYKLTVYTFLSLLCEIYTSKWVHICLYILFNILHIENGVKCLIWWDVNSNIFHYLLEYFITKDCNYFGEGNKCLSNIWSEEEWEVYINISITLSYSLPCKFDYIMFVI